MAFEFRRPIEDYAKMVTPKMLKDAFEEYGFEVELNEKTFTVDSTAFKTFFLKNPSFTKAAIETYENDLDNLFIILKNTSVMNYHQKALSLSDSSPFNIINGYESDDNWSSLIRNTVKGSLLYKGGKIANPTFVIANDEEELIPNYHALRINELTIPGVV